jgi:hypothetical protein
VNKDFWEITCLEQKTKLVVEGEKIPQNGEIILLIFILKLCQSDSYCCFKA